MLVVLFLGVLHFLGLAPARAETQFEVTIPTTLGDTTETFWMQLPGDYQPGTPRPLLVGWHQLGGNCQEMRQATVFDSIADARGWIAASPNGPSPTHWNNQAAQSHVVDVIRWIEAHYSVDEHRIYMVGASMGGAAGMVFAGNHLDPRGPMVAAAASLSGIQDCERRFHEQGTNVSMMGAFGGTPEEVPFTYHRNSAVCFADSTEDMHVNARHLPLYLTFGHGDSDQIWREHAEDLYPVLASFADSVVIRESDWAGHGWGCAEEVRICDFLGAFTLDPAPRRISVSADEEGRWYWSDLRMRHVGESFARFEGEVRPDERRVIVTLLRNVRRLGLDLPSAGLPMGGFPFVCDWSVLDGAPAEIEFDGVVAPPTLVLRDGEPFARWTHDPARSVLSFSGEGGSFAVFFDPSAVRTQTYEADRPILEVRAAPGGTVLATVRAPGQVGLTLYDVVGRGVFALPSRWHAAGSIRLAAPDWPASGVYFARVTWEAAGRVEAASARVLVVR